MSLIFHSQPCLCHVNCPIIALCLSFPRRDDAGGTQRAEISCPSKPGLGNLPAQHAVLRVKPS